MSEPVRFPYLPVVNKRGGSVPMPLLPLELWLGEGLPVRVQGLLDSGATVNVIPFSLGRRLGAAWDAQKIAVTLTGNPTNQLLLTWESISTKHTASALPLRWANCGRRCHLRYRRLTTVFGCFENGPDGHKNKPQKETN